MDNGKKKPFLGIWSMGIGIGIMSSLLDIAIIALGLELVFGALWLIGNGISYWLGGPCYYE